jgi:hypothetical protein
LDIPLPNAVPLPADVGDVDNSGNFDFTAPAATNLLTEGYVTIAARCVKSPLASPYYSREYVLDINPPEVIDVLPVPSGNASPTVVSTLSPAVACKLVDRPTAANPRAAVSGISGNFTSFLFRGPGEPRPVDYHMDPGLVDFPAGAPGALDRGRRSIPEGEQLILIDRRSRLPMKLQEGGVYEVLVDGSDNARYKTRKEWRFRVDIDERDATPPLVSQALPTGDVFTAAPAVSCVVADPESGLDASSLRMVLSEFPGGALVPGGIGPENVPDAYDCQTGRASFTPLNPLLPGTYQVSVYARNWAAGEASEPPLVSQWTFTVR